MVGKLCERERVNTDSSQTKQKKKKGKATWLEQSRHHPPQRHLRRAEGHTNATSHLEVSAKVIGEGGATKPQHFLITIFYAHKMWSNSIFQWLCVAKGDRNTSFQQLIAISHSAARKQDERRRVRLLDFKKTIKFPRRMTFKL